MSKCHCGRPARSKGLCQAHSKAARRFSQDGTNRRSGDSLVSGTRTPKNTPSDQDFVHNFSGLSQNQKVTLENGVLRKGDEYQMVGVYCPDCRGEIIATSGGNPIRRKPDASWCVSDRHPIFDASGRIIQMARPE